jgi:hypothetical protein
VARPFLLPASNPHRAACWLVFAVLVLFAFTVSGAMAAYPGGTFFDPDRQGYDFWRNFWCDALRDPALNGAPNAHGARLATIALWVLSSGLMPFWSIAAALYAGRRRPLRRAIAVLGVAAMLGMMGVTLLPSNQFPLLHGSLALIAGPPAFVAMLLCLLSSRGSPRVPARVTWLGAAALLFALGNFVEYGREFWLGVRPWPLLPALQKLVTILFLGWVTALCAIAFSGKRP